MTACKSHKGVINQGNSEITPISNNDLSDLRKKIIAEAMSWLGTPYKYAHSEKGTGTDCSGMVMCVIEEITGVKIPRNSAKQAEFCQEINLSDAYPGDLVFFATGKNKHKISHVGILVDDDRFIHASSSKGVVISRLSSAYYTRCFIKCCRLPE